MDLTFSLDRGFDFVLYLCVRNPLLTPVMTIYGIGRFWEARFDMLKSMEFGNLVGFHSSCRRLIGSTKVDLWKMTLKDSYRGKLQDDQ